MNEKIEKMKQKNYVLTNVQPMLISGNTKEDLQAKGIPFEEYLDLVLFCCLPADIDSYMPVTDEILEETGTTWKELFASAMENLEGHYSVDYLENILARTLGITFTGVPQDMLVVSNNRMRYGSAVIASTVILQDVEAKLGGDFVVLPSSIHEVICVPNSEVSSLTDMVDLVTKVNDMDVAERDRLSYNAYWFHNNRLYAALTKPERRIEYAKM